MEGLLSVAEARERLLSIFHPVESERVKLEMAANRVLAQTVAAPFDLPLFANSSMDGFAVRSQDVAQASTHHPVRLPVVADVPAGSPLPEQLPAGQAARIMTGAPLPPGADAVIPVEDTDFNYRQPGIALPPAVTFYRPAEAGMNVRPRGQDLHAGEIVMQPNKRLRPQEVGLLSTLGLSEVEVYRRPRVALFSSGDELLPAGAEIQPGKIYDANSFVIAALIEQYGAQAVNLGIFPDRLEAVAGALEQAASLGVDFILTSAGVSVGAFDFVRSAVEAQGELLFWRVNMRPGKPLVTGHYRHVPFIGLPGNPVSAFVGFEVFVRPAILKLAGLKRWDRPSLRVVLAEAVESDGRESYLRARVDWEGGQHVAHLTGHQGSGNLRSLVQANALLIINSGVKSLPSGAETEAWLIDDLWLNQSS